MTPFYPAVLSNLEEMVRTHQETMALGQYIKSVCAYCMYMYMSLGFW